MTDSWDQVRQHERRRRIRLVLAAAALLVTLYAAGNYLDIPLRISQFRNQYTEHVDSHKQPSEGSGTSIRESLADSAAAPASEDVVSRPQPYDVETQDPTRNQFPGAPSEIADTQEQTLQLDEVNPKRRTQADLRLQKLTSRIAEVDGSTHKLDTYGGKEWAEIERLTKQARDSQDSTNALKLADEALSRLDRLAIDVAFLELRETTKTMREQETLNAYVEFTSQYPDHPQKPELLQTVVSWNRDQWQSFAVAELETAAPDDGGFAEAWLPIASTWFSVGNETEARESIRRAREALERMTSAERAIESTIDLCQHPSFDAEFSHQLIVNAADQCRQIADKWNRGTYYAHLSGLAALLGHQSLSDDLADRAVAPENMNVEFGVTEKLILTQQCRIAAWKEKPDKLFAKCDELKRLNYPKPAVNCNAYGHAAIAAARHHDLPQFRTAMLLAENALAPLRGYDYPNYLYAVRLAEANIHQRRWRAAVITANNIPDPGVRASLLFRVLNQAPQEVRSPQLLELFTHYTDRRFSSMACASFAEHRLRTGDDVLSVASWVRQLPRASQRASAYSGIARAIESLPANNNQAEQTDLIDSGPIAAPDIDDTASLFESAERIARETERPINAAFLWLRIAQTSNLLGERTRYHNAIEQIDNRLFDAWYDVWMKRPPVKHGYNGGYLSSNDKHLKQEVKAIGWILAVHQQTAEMQADLGDSRGAMESCLNLANAAGFHNSKPTFNDQSFLLIKALLNRLANETGVGSDALPFPEHRSFRYTNAIVAAWSDDSSALELVVPDLAEHSQRRNASAAERAQPARAYAELAVLHAEHGNIKGYRSARRSAESLITQRRAGHELKLVLATADAMAGEYELAEAGLVRGSVPWFGDANRPRSQLAVSLAADGQWHRALKQAEQVSTSDLVYRGNVWQAVAKARRMNAVESNDELHDWLASIEHAPDQVAAFCGLALATANSR